MGKLYLLSFRIILLSIIALAFNNSLVMSMVRHEDDKTKSEIFRITDTRPDKPNLILTPATFQLTDYNNYTDFTNLQQDDNTLKVKIYPVPVVDQINVSYHLNKESNVTIQIMNFLGNKVMTLLSQRVSAGDQNNSFPIASKLNSGIYFVQVIVSNQKLVTKRISVQN